MTDLENVIAELTAEIEGASHCRHCGLAVTMENALSLLKAQEPIEPIIKQEMDDVCSCIDAVAYCGKCGAQIGRLKQNYCPNCGKGVKWE